MTTNPNHKRKVDIPIRGTTLSSDSKGKLTEDIEKLRKSLKKEVSKSASYLNQLKYLQADFDNYRKRIQKDSENQTFHEIDRLILEIIEIRDNIDRALKSVNNESKMKSVKNGLEIIKQRIESLISNEGVEDIKSLKELFNPSFHEVVSIGERDDLEDNLITNEIRKGYLIKGRVLRTSLVEVNKRKTK